MNGSDSHEQAIDKLEAAFIEKGIGTARQVFVWCDGRKGYIDLEAFTSSGMIACEIERSPARVDRDLTKAMHSHAIRLWIVVLNHRVKARVRKKLTALNVQENKFLSIFTVPQAVKEVTRLTELNSRVVVD